MFGKLVKAVVVLLAVLLVAAFATGLLSPRKTWNQLRVQGSQAAASVGNVSVAPMNTAKPSAREVEMAKQCRANLSSIESAKRRVAERDGKTMGDVSQAAVLKELGGKMPVCPKGGSYAIGTNEQLPRCSITANGSVDKSDDHFLDQF